MSPASSSTRRIVHAQDGGLRTRLCHRVVGRPRPLYHQPRRFSVVKTTDLKLRFQHFLTQVVFFQPRGGGKLSRLYGKLSRVTFKLPEGNM